MRIITKLIAVCFTAFLVSCTENKTVETETTPATTETQKTNETEVVMVETKAPENSTEVSIGENGAKVETKDRANGTKFKSKILPIVH